MAFSNDEKQEIKDIVLETMTEQSDAVDYTEQVVEFAPGDEVPIVRNGNGTGEKSYGRAPVSMFGGGGSSGVNGIKVGGSGQVLTPTSGVVTLPAYESGAEKNPVKYLKEAAISQDGNSLTIKDNNNETKTFTPIGGGGGSVTPSDADPLEDGTKSAGSSTSYSRGDHRHPHDTTKVDKENGKGLSSNDYTTDEKNKLNGIEAGAEKHKAPTSQEVKNALGTGSGTTKYLREDGQWAKPQDGGNTADVNYDTTNKKITKTIDGTTSDVVTVATLKTDMNLAKGDVGLGSVVNTGDSATPSSGGTTKFTTGGAYTELAKKVDKTTTVNGHALNGNVLITKSDVGLGNVGNFKAVSTEANQGLTSTERLNARTNIGAGTSNFSGSYDDLSNKPNNEELLVDLGLSSGTLWATRNLDATQPNGFAKSPFQYECSFVSWGNTETHNPVSTSAFSYNWGTANNGPYASTHGSTLTEDFKIGDDAANATLGGDWRMPTASEFQELIDNCDFVAADGTTVISTADKRITLNGVVGAYLKSKNNGKHIFFPCSGDGQSRNWVNRGAAGYYWTSSINDTARKHLIIYSADTFVSSSLGFWGFAVRPVQNPVLKVKVGTTEYSAKDGMVTIPAYPTTLPASDVSAWAKASTKPSYTKSEIGLGNVGNFKAVSTEASQGLSDTEKGNARTNIGAGTYSKPDGGIPETDFTQDVRDKLLVKNLSCEPMFGISEAEILGASRYGLMQSMVAASIASGDNKGDWILGFIHQQPQSGESYANALFCALFDHSGNYLGKSNINVSNFHANDATIIGSYVYICNGGGSSSNGIRRISTSTLISQCKNGSTSSTSLVSSIEAISMDYDATNNDVCVYDGDLKIYDTSFSLKRTAVTSPETKIRSKFGSFINTIVWQGLVYKDNKAYTLNVAEMSENVNCTIMCVFDLVTGDIINVYRVPAFSSWMEIQGCFKNPLKNDEILASYNIWSHGSLDGSWGVAIIGVLRISLSGMVASPTSSIRVDNPSFDEMNSQRTVYIDNTYYGTDSFSYSLGTKEAPFKRFEDAYQVVAGASNVSFMLANTSKTYQVYDRITARNTTISIETWSKYPSGPSKATLASVFRIDHGSLKLDNLSISLGSSQSADVGNSAFFNFRESGFRMANCDISVTTTIKDNIFAAVNSKLTIFTNCSLSTRTGVMFLLGNSEVNFFNNPIGSIDTISIYCGTFIDCYSTGNKVYADVRCLSDLSDITTLVNLSRCTEPVLYISNANLPEQATPLKASCVSSSSRGSIAVVQDGSWVDTMGKGVYTNDTSYGTVEGYVFFERTTGIPLVYRKKGTTLQRPDLSGYTGKDAIPYNNTTTGKVEFWNGSSWV